MSSENGFRTKDGSVASRSVVRRDNPGLVAWVVLGTAFVVFLACAISLPAFALHYVDTAARENRTEVQVVSGSAQLMEKALGRWLAISGTERVSQGDGIETNESSRCILLVYEGTTDYILTTVHVFSNTGLELVEATTPRFGSSSRHNRVHFALNRGRLRLNPGPSLERELDLLVSVPGGVVIIEEGSVALEVAADSSEVSVRGGRAMVVTEITGEQLVLEAGERAVLTDDGSLAGPLPAGRNLVANSDFGAGLSLAWETYNDQGGDAGNVDGEVYLTEYDGQRVAHFRRLGGQRDHCATGIRQFLRVDVTDYVSLRIRADVRLLYQSLSGGGFQGSEFPVMIKLNYRDAKGNPQFYTWGFYYQNPENHPTPYAEQIERGVWYAYESPNLMAALGDIKPAFLEYIEVYASGHDYESEVNDIQVVVE